MNRRDTITALLAIRATVGPLCDLALVQLRADRTAKRLFQIFAPPW
jgi:hypothetical protein